MTARPWTTPVPSSARPLSSGGVATKELVTVGSNASLGGVASVSSGNTGSGGGIDLDELHRTYRILELTRKQTNEESANTLRMQRQQIEKLKKDNDRLKEDLALETRQARQANNMSATAQISKLQDQGDIYTRKIEAERRRLEELDKQIKRLQNSILLQRKEMGGIHATRDSNINIQKQIRILENRLDKALVKFNEALAHNKMLRDQIDNLRRERVVFDGIYNKLARELQKKQSDMGEIMYETNNLASQREQAQLEMQQLKMQADHEQQEFERKWRKLGMEIDVDRRGAKDQLGGMNKTGQSRALLPGGPRGGDPTIEAESNLRKRVTKGTWSIATDKANIHLSMEKVQAYEEAFAKIQKATRITDIDQLVHTFVHAEDQNFSLFNYVNDLSNEIEKVEEQNNQVKAALAKLKAADGNGNNSMALTIPAPPSGITTVGAVPVLPPSNTTAAETQDAGRKKLLAELDAKLQKNNTRARESELRFEQGSKTLLALKSGIGSIFQKLGCESKESSELLGNAGVTESNIMQYLGLIEARTNDLLATYQKHREEMGEEMGGIGGQQQDYGYAAPSSQQQQQSAQRHHHPHPPSSSSSSHGHRGDVEPSISAPSAGGGGGVHGGDQEEDDEEDETLGGGGAAGNDIGGGMPSSRRGAGADNNDDEEQEDEDGELTEAGQPINVAQQMQQQQQRRREEY